MLIDLSEIEAFVLDELINDDLDVMDALEEEEIDDHELPLEDLLSRAADRADRKRLLLNLKRRLGT